MDKEEKIIGRMSQASLGLFLPYWIFLLYRKLRPDFLQGSAGLVGMVLLYGLGSLIFYLLVRDLPKQEPRKKALEPGDFRLALAFQLDVQPILIVINILLALISQKPLGQEVEVDGLLVINLVLVAPLAEEFVYRKLLGGRMGQYSGGVYMVLSALLFAIPHSWSMGLGSLFACFGLGLVYAFIYWKSGQFFIPLVYHIVYNSMNGLAILFLAKAFGPQLAGPYIFFLILLGLLSMIYFIDIFY